MVVDCAIMRDGCVVLLMGVCIHLTASISGNHHVCRQWLLVFLVATLHEASDSILYRVS